MTQRISSEQEEKTGHAQALVRCYGDSVQANTKLVERAASSMEEPDMAAFVQVGGCKSIRNEQRVTVLHILLTCPRSLKYLCVFLFILPSEFKGADHKVSIDHM